MAAGIRRCTVNLRTLPRSALPSLPSTAPSTTPTTAPSTTPSNLSKKKRGCPKGGWPKKGDQGCNEEEVRKEEEELRPGSLVLAFLGDWGWWPALVDTDPKTRRFTKVEKGLCKMRVVFLEENPTKSWVVKEKVVKFTGEEVEEDNFQERQEAYFMARTMVELEEEARLERFWGGQQSKSESIMDEEEPELQEREEPPREELMEQRDRLAEKEEDLHAKDTLVEEIDRRIRSLESTVNSQAEEMARMLEEKRGPSLTSPSPPCLTSPTSPSPPCSPPRCEVTMSPLLCRPPLSVKDISALLSTSPTPGAATEATDQEETKAARREEVVTRLKHEVAREVRRGLKKYNHTKEPELFKSRSWEIFDAEDFTEVCRSQAVSCREEVMERWARRSDGLEGLELAQEDVARMQAGLELFFRIREAVSLRLDLLGSRVEAAQRQEFHSISSTVASLLPTSQGARLHAAATTDYYFALREEVGRHLASLLGLGEPSYRRHIAAHSLLLFRQLMATAAVLTPGAAPALTDDARLAVRDHVAKKHLL